ncbi:MULTISPECIES: transporter substrate-binding domain-containing protein [Pseudomonas]|uniref:Transporter substrate-binding domain-containing protein n=1 Tax=Pseudomonas azadiae TaxID=2843612 RepID=A0ABS6P5V4_9PSED|nr:MULTISPECIES: transporter substrate-binding domain-containing protein [Pseudomonas]MBV4455810.1 transporter substrate-binding domain-containing protein [Pseudomonas azadiae]NMF41698.1 transporter substrate-binding domain-containing protein [Pseudomonas sp. SWRI 103]
MNTARHVSASLLLALAAATFMASAVANSTLDQVISSKTLRCGVQLDYPPAGFRNRANEPDGYDVQYCKDMAHALGAEAVIVETPSSERIPALVSNRIDVLIASASISPQRAMSVSFSQPYVNYTNVVLTRKGANIESFQDLKGRHIGGVTGTTTEQELQVLRKGWNDQNGSYTGFGSEAEGYLALAQGKIDGVIIGNASAAALVQSGQFPTLAIKGVAPTPPDLCGIAVKRSDTQMLNWVKTFVWAQVKNGRYKELYAHYFGEGQAPSLTVAGVDY